MTLNRVVRLTGVKAQRSDQRLSDLQRCRRQLADAEQSLADAKSAVETFKRERQEAMQLAYAEICGEELSEFDLRNLNQKLDRLVEQETSLSANLTVYRSAVAEAQDQLRHATLRFHMARRNQEKWEQMVKPMVKMANRENERRAEIDRDDQLSARRKAVG